MMASLVRRLEVAKTANDSELTKIIEQERQQIAFPVTRCKQQQLTTWLKTFKQGVATIFGSFKPQVCQFVNGSDCWWYAIDPKTAESIYADSKAELRLWI